MSSFSTKNYICATIKKKKKRESFKNRLKYGRDVGIIRQGVLKLSKINKMMRCHIKKNTEKQIYPIYERNRTKIVKKTKLMRIYVHQI